MAFPFSIKRRFTPEIAPDFLNTASSDLIISQITTCLKSSEFTPEDIEEGSNSIIFTTKNSIVGFRYSISVLLAENKKNSVIFKYHLFELNVIILILVVFSVFFSRFYSGNLLIFAAIAILFFYLLNVLFIDTSVKRFLFSIPVFNLPVEIQNQRMIERKHAVEKVCPICGYGKIKAGYCNICGYEKDKHEYFFPTHTTKYSHKKIKYHFKTSKEK